MTGKITEYTYNALDLIEKVTDNGNVAAEYSYYPDGSIRSLRNGRLYTEYAFDADKNLTGLKTMLGAEVLADSHYAYDLNGNRTEKRQLNGITRYTYDALNQLTKVQYPSYTEELYYDRAGNRTKRMAKGVEELYKYDPRNRLTEYTKGGVETQFTYDNAGNLLKDDRAKYTYDAFNRTEKVETFDGHVQINRYDAEGLRHEMEEDGRLVQFIFRGDEIAAEEKDGSIIRYIRGYDLIASDAESARTYYHYASDEMSSITHVVGGERILNRYEYDAWGNDTVCEETVENRFRFNGQQYDPITRQYYLRARFYNPVIARFTQEDTYRGDGLNLYAYCANNPVYYVDPSGNMCWKEAYRLLKEKRPDLSDDDALALVKSRKVKDAIAAINKYQNKTGTKLKDHQSYAFIQDAIDGYNVKHFAYNRRKNDVAARNSRFTGLHSLVSYKSKNQIKHHAATITKFTIEMGGTEPSKTSRNWLKSIIKGTKLTTEDVDYGHIVGNHGGGSGNLSGKNGFVQDKGINRGRFAKYQGRIDDYVVNNKVKAATFVTLECGQNKDIPNKVHYEVNYSDGHYDNKDFPNIN